MRRFLFFTLSLALLAAPAMAGPPPYLKLAQALGTPHLAESTGPKDKSRLLLHFVREGEDEKNWTKMTTISILKVPETDTEGATRGVAHELRDGLKESKAHVDTFDESPLPPVTVWFEFTGDGEDQKGVLYSPAPGFVTVAQVGVHNGGTIDEKDVAYLKGLIAPKP
jgi:hypothetical protein